LIQAQIRVKIYQSLELFFQHSIVCRRRDRCFCHLQACCCNVKWSVSLLESKSGDSDLCVLDIWRR